LVLTSFVVGILFLRFFEMLIVANNHRDQETKDKNDDRIDEHWVRNKSWWSCQNVEEVACMELLVSLVEGSDKSLHVAKRVAYPTVNASAWVSGIFLLKFLIVDRLKSEWMDSMFNKVWVRHVNFACQRVFEAFHNVHDVVHSAYLLFKQLENLIK